MKGSTLHRSGLTREKMGVLASLVQTDKKQQGNRSQLNQYSRAAKVQELDVLWGGINRGIQKVHSVAKSSSHKSPAAFLTIGFIAGVLFMGCITLIVSLSSVTPKDETPVAAAETNKSANVALIGEDGIEENAVEEIVTQEKYVVTKGDTLNGIAYRFYGKYDEAKIREIQRVNNITNPAGLRIGQELMIPVSQDR